MKGRIQYSVNGNVSALFFDTIEEAIKYYNRFDYIFSGHGGQLKLIRIDEIEESEYKEYKESKHV
jgi:hypothetical protein